MPHVIVDTSSMMFGFSHNRNVFEAVQRRFPTRKPLVSRGILAELRAISENRGKRGASARLALLEIKAKKIDVDNITEYADKWILDASPRRGKVVITNDTALARRLLSRGVVVFKMSVSGEIRPMRPLK